MKKSLFCSAALLLTATLLAQPDSHPDGPPKPPPVSERWKYDSTKLQLYVVLTNEQMNNVKSAFFSFYSDMDAVMERGKNRPPSREEMEKIRTKRSTALKAIFDGQQFNRFQTFEREFMPPPPMPPHPPKRNDIASPERV